MSSFDSIKSEILRNLEKSNDNSPKGSLDEPVRSLVHLINGTDAFVTTSSCSGRISIYRNHSLTKGIDWLLVRHGLITYDDIVQAVSISSSKNTASDETVIAATETFIYLKCEPLILHVCCRDVDAGKRLHQLALESGFRESGLGLGTKRVVLAIRTTAFALELPLAKGTTTAVEFLVDRSYLEIIVEAANTRLLKNFARIDRFLNLLKSEWSWPSIITALSNYGIATPNLSRWGHTLCSCPSMMSTGKALDNGADKVPVVLSYSFGGYGVDELDYCVSPSPRNQNKAEITNGWSTASKGVSRVLAPLRITETRRDKRDRNSSSNNDKNKSIICGNGRLHYSRCSMPITQASQCPFLGVHIASGFLNFDNNNNNNVNDTTLFFILSGGRNSPGNAALPISRIIRCSDSSGLFDDVSEGVKDIGDRPLDRWGHTLSPLGQNRFFIYGGRNESRIFDDGYLLSVSVSSSENLKADTPCIVCTWKCVFGSSSSDGVKNVPPGRFFHAACSVQTHASKCPMEQGGARQAEADAGTKQSYDAVIIHGGLISLDDPQCTGDFFVVYPFRDDYSRGRSQPDGDKGDEQNEDMIMAEWRYLIPHKEVGEGHPRDSSMHKISDFNGHGHEAELQAPTLMLSLSRFGHTLSDIGARSIYIAGGQSFAISASDDERNTIDTNDDNDGLGDRVLHILVNENGLLTGFLRRPLSTPPPHQQPLDSNKLNDSSLIYPCSACRVHHQAIVTEADALSSPFSDRYLHLIGGGATCLAFGQHFCDSVALRVCYRYTLGRSFFTETDAPNAAVVASQSDAGDQILSEATLNKTEISTCLLIPPQKVKKLKVLLETFGFLDKMQRISSVDVNALGETEINLVDILNGVVVGRRVLSTHECDVSSFMSVPILSELCSVLMIESSSELGGLGPQPPLQLQLQSQLQQLQAGLAPEASVLVANVASIRMNKLLSVSSFRKASDYLESVISKYSLDASQARKEIPRKFEMLSDVLLIAENELTDSSLTWGPVLNASTAVAQQFWRGLSECVSATRIVRKARIDSGHLRESRITFLFPTAARSEEVAVSGTESTQEETKCREPETGPGSLGWVVTQENGIKYGFDITRVMYSSGNNTEKIRMGKERMEGLVVADLYCGIGYWTLPFLVHGGAKLVHAFEWNPNSLLALKENLAMAGVSDRCEIHPGDNSVSAFKPELDSVADRVCLGLLPTSVKGWPLAVRLLKKSGGMLFVHENIASNKKEEWVQQTCEDFIKLFEQAGKRVVVSCRRLETVKSYAPRIHHVVADLVVQERM